ncbi:MAG: hypothetical protein RMI91_14890 [Gemmatales bacterium]|nr:hypothetical protein [Gemmatales bacterium]MDW7995930.1 hypothetical protein [Gemmatales bacterium]
MTNWRRWLCGLLGLALVAALLTGLVVLLRHEPGYYRRGHVPPSPQRSQCSAEFYRQISSLVSMLSDPEPDQPWQLRLRQDQINSYLAEGFVEAQLHRELPEGVQEPRVALEQDLIRIGFRYGHAPWSTIVTLELRLWISLPEPNAVMLQVRRVRIGAVPVPVRYVQELLANLLRRRTVEVTWYRYEGLPVAVIRFQASRRAPTFHFTALRIEPGEFVLQGRTVAPGN